MENYYPSNGTEGQIFIEKFCDKCYKGNRCKILLNSLIGKQPKQWIYDEQGKSKCTSFNSTRPKKIKRNQKQTEMFCHGNLTGEVFDKWTENIFINNKPIND